MTLPYRDWRVFESAHVEGKKVGVGSWNDINLWTTNNFAYMKTGDSWDDGSFYYRWTALTRPTASNFKSYTSLDQVLDIYVESIITENVNTKLQTTLQIFPRFFYQAVGDWIPGLVNGKHYDGVLPWDDFSRSTLSGSGEIAEVTLIDTPQTIGTWFYSYVGGTGPTTNNDQARFFRNGVGFYAGNYDPGLDRFSTPPPDTCNAFITSSLIRARYLNAVVNSLSTNHAGTAAGTVLVLTGICFNPPTAELNEHTIGGGPSWNNNIAGIYFEKTPGSADYVLTQGVGVGKFVINSDGQITATLPAMAEGTYIIRLRKVNVSTIGTIDSYAGDFSANGDGLVTEGTRMRFTVGDDFVPPEETQPLILTDWRWKNKAGDLALRSYSPIDAPSPEVFYDGRLTSISSLKRAVDDNTGVFSISDMTVSIANHDKEISALLAEYFLKNQIVDIYYHFGGQSYSDRISIQKCIVDDYSLEGTNFPVILKDITRKYFKVKIPRFRCTEEEFEFIHDSAKGRVMPEILGLCSVTGVTTPGAVEAVYIDTVNFKYLAARGSLYSVDEVYSDNKKMTEGVDYDIIYADGGRTYIDFGSDQGDNKITFNCKGYAYDTLYDWNSGNGYIQNPIYMQLFLLAFIAEIPWELIDLASFDTLAALFVTNGWDESGHFILQDETNLDEALKGLLFTCGNYGFIAIDGRFKVIKKSIDDYESTTLIIFDQIDLMSPAKKNYNLRSAVNYIQAIYDFYPAPSLFYGSLEDKRESSIEDYEAEIEADSSMEFPWTNSRTLIQDRLAEILFKRGYGDNRITFQLSIKWFKKLDLLINFKFQDPWGISSTKSGEEGRYYYIISLNYNWTAGTIDVEAVDLQWLLRQHIIIGDENEQAPLWLNAPENDRIYFYTADEDTGTFEDKEPGKIA